MKINDLRTLIREEIQNELAEAKKKKKKEAKEKIMEIIIEAELTEEELEESFKNLIQRGVAKIGLGSYPAPEGPHTVTPEALKAVFNKIPKIISYYMKEFKMTLDQLIKLYQTETGKEFNDARYWIQTWYDATVKKDPDAIKAWKNSDTSDISRYLPNPQGAVGLASTAGNSPTNIGGI